jgi:hypothetical protein
MRAAPLVVLAHTQREEDEMKRLPITHSDRRIRRPEPAAMTDARDAALAVAMRLRGF